MSDHLDSILEAKTTDRSDSPKKSRGKEPRDTWESSPVVRETFLRLYLEPEEAEVFRRASRIVYLAILGSLVPDPAGYPTAEHVRESLAAARLELEHLSGFLLDVGMGEVDEPENAKAEQLRKRADGLAEALLEMASNIDCSLT